MSVRICSLLCTSQSHASRCVFRHSKSSFRTLWHISTWPIISFSLLPFGFMYLSMAVICIHANWMEILNWCDFWRCMSGTVQLVSIVSRCTGSWVYNVYVRPWVHLTQKRNINLKRKSFYWVLSILSLNSNFSFDNFNKK